MAEDPDIEKSKAQNEQLLKQLQDALDRFGAKSKTLADRVSDYVKIVEEQKEILSDANDNQTEKLEAKKKINLREENLQKKYVEDYKKHVDEQKKLLKAGEITSGEYNTNLAEYSKNISDQIKDPELKEKFKLLSASAEKTAEAQMRMQARVDAASASFKALGNIGAPIVAGLNKVVSGYRDSGSQVGVATSVITAGTEAAGGALQAAGSAASAAGQAVSGLGKYGKIAGFALQGLGTIAGLAGSGLSAIAQKVLPFLSGELNKNIAAFQSMSASGALFSNGLTGMINTAGTAGMTLDQFNNVVKNNTESLSSLGEGVTAGAKRAAGALQAGGDTMRKQLLNLGYSVEEQGTLVAETMATMRQSGGPLTASNAQVAEETKKYAENLRVISSITGEDAKKKMDQIKKENMNLAFQQKLAGMDETQRAAIVRAQANMSDLQRQAFQQMMVFGQVVTPELAATVAQSDNLRSSVEEATQRAQAGTLDEASMRQINAERGDAIKQELLSLQGLAQAGMAGVGGLVGSINESLAKELDFRNRFNERSIAAAESDVRGQRDTADQLTSSMNDVVIANQNAAKAIQDAILNSNVMTHFANATAKATEGLTNLIKEFAPAASAGAGGNAAEQNAQNAKTFGETAGSVIGGAAGAAFGPAGAIAGSIIGEKIGGVVAEKLARATTITEEQRGQLTDLSGPSGISQFARGGFIDGPKSGTLAMLHGKEVVMPLPSQFQPSDLTTLLTSMGSFDTSMALIDDSLKSITSLNTNILSQMSELSSAETPGIQVTDLFDGIVSTLGTTLDQSQQKQQGSFDAIVKNLTSNVSTSFEQFTEKNSLGTVTKDLTSTLGSGFEKLNQQNPAGAMFKDITTTISNIGKNKKDPFEDDLTNKIPSVNQDTLQKQFETVYKNITDQIPLAISKMQEANKMKQSDDQQSADLNEIYKSIVNSNIAGSEKVGKLVSDVFADLNTAKSTDLGQTVNVSLKDMPESDRFDQITSTLVKAIDEKSGAEEVTPTAARDNMMLEALNTSVRKNDDNLVVLSKLTEQMEELLRHTRNVVANTERTARGVT